MARQRRRAGDQHDRRHLLSLRRIVSADRRRLRRRQRLRVRLRPGWECLDQEQLRGWHEFLPFTTGSTYDAANRLATVNGAPYTWSPTGNLLSDGVSTYRYDAANRLISVTSGVTTTTFAYNGQGDAAEASPPTGGL